MNHYNQDLLDEFERMVSEGAPCPQVELEIYNFCSYGSHNMVWYEGLHLDRFWFCTVCDTKDKTTPPPNTRS